MGEHAPCAMPLVFVRRPSADHLVYRFKLRLLLYFDSADIYALMCKGTNAQQAGVSMQT
jgi:hypothetical protein